MTEQQFMLAAQSLSTPSLDWTMRALSAAATTPLYVLVASLLFWVIDRRRGGALGLLLVVSTWVNSLTKVYVAEARPTFEGLRRISLVEPADYSFPSGHSQAAAAFTVFVAIWLWSRGQRRWAVWLALFPLAVGFSRIYLGMHFPRDVVAGFIVGGALGLLFSGAAFTYLLAGAGRGLFGLGSLVILGLFLAWWAVGGTELVLAGVWVGFVIGQRWFVPAAPPSGMPAVASDRNRLSPALALAIWAGGVVLVGLMWVAVSWLPPVFAPVTPGIALVRRAWTFSGPQYGSVDPLNLMYFVRGLVVGLAATSYPTIAERLIRNREGRP